MIFKIFNRSYNINIRRNKQYVRKFMEALDIQPDVYEINDDGTVDIYDDFTLSDYTSNMKSLPIDFNIAYGNFSVAETKIKTLKGCPKQVNGFFDCSDNELETLKYIPEIVNGGLFCNDNLLKSLDYLPSGFNLLDVSDNLLSNTINFPKLDIDISIIIDNNYSLLSKLGYKNVEYLKKIIDNQNDYKIWTDNHDLNQGRYNILLDDIKNGII